MRTASSATTSAKPHRPSAANASTGLRGSRASRYNPSHPLSVNTTTDSAAMHPVWHAPDPPLSLPLLAVPAMALAVVTQRAQKIDPAERGPVRLGEPHLRVRALPQQEPRQALLPRGADYQVGVGLPGGVKVFGDRFGGHRVDELLRGGAVGEFLAQQSPHRVDDLAAAAIADGDVDVERRHGRGGLHRVAQAAGRFLPDEPEIPDGAHAPAIGGCADLL